MEKPIDVHALATHFQITCEGPDFDTETFDPKITRKYDLPPEISLESLYIEPSQELRFSRLIGQQGTFTSLCFGLERAQGDFQTGKVLPYWQFPDLPEYDVNL